MQVYLQWFTALLCLAGFSTASISSLSLICLHVSRLLVTIVTNTRQENNRVTNSEKQTNMSCEISNKLNITLIQIYMRKFVYVANFVYVFRGTKTKLSTRRVFKFEKKIVSDLLENLYFQRVLSEKDCWIVSFHWRIWGRDGVARDAYPTLAQSFFAFKGSFGEKLAK